MTNEREEPPKANKSKGRKKKKKGNRSRVQDGYTSSTVKCSSGVKTKRDDKRKYIGSEGSLRSTKQQNVKTDKRKVHVVWFKNSNMRVHDHHPLRNAHKRARQDLAVRKVTLLYVLFDIVFIMSVTYLSHQHVSGCDSYSYSG